MSTYLQPRSGRRNAFAVPTFVVLLSAVALFATVASAGAPGGTPAYSKTQAGGTPSPTPTSCPQHWEVVYSPNPYNQDQLYGVAAISDTDMWAVGSSGTALTEHWDGSAWGVVTSTIAMSISVLYDVAAPSTNDAWAVGAYSPDGQYPLRAVILHWDGTLWDLAPSPSTSPGSYLYGLEAISASDIWAVGTQNNNTQTLAMHWNGTAWTVITTPNPGTGSNVLQHVSALATNNVWAVGYSGQGAPLVIHWDGNAWTNVPTTFQGALHDVLALSSSNVWAVGDSLILHWNGSTWTSYPGVQGVLESLAAASPNDIWVSGTTDSSYGDGLVMHWDGTTWSLVPSPQIPVQGGALHAVVSISSSEVWAMGEAREAYNNHLSTVTMRYHPDCPMPTECSTGWNVVRGAYPGLDGGVTFGVASVSSNDVWAVGTGLEGERERPLMEHWDGSYWSSVPGPSIPTNANLNAVSAISTNDVWAVGLIYTNGMSLEERLTQSGANSNSNKPGRTKVPNAYGTLTIHWDGQAWSWIPSPGPQTFNNPLDAVDGVASNDVWAAGALSFLHWNGTNWTQIDLGLGQGEIKSIAAIATNNVWAVGFIYDPGSWNGLIMHWDGVTWTRVTSQSLTGHLLNDISAVSGNDIWATGNGIFMHWDGSQWTPVQVPGSSPSNVTALAANDVWASTSTNMLHWDGINWMVVATPTPEPETGQDDVMDMAAASSNEIWAVGYIRRPLTLLPIIERYVGSCQTPTATPMVSAVATQTTTPPPSATPATTSTRTNTPISTVSASTPTPTRTRTATSSATSATNPTYTPTSCPIQFSDVPSGSTFYPYIRCLACRGIVNGYSDGTFKPNNNVTRGQLSKIVSSSAGFNDPQPTQMFQDVPAGSTFQLYIGRLATRGYISGYPCGSTGEQCVAPGNLPYFRPNNNATRGQIAKIDANAAGYSDPPVGQTFEDVPAGSTFYTYTQRLTSRAVMSGYPCGGTGEPCNPPGNLPYFRPFNNATRGQTSKIVVNTFFPNCQTPERR